jgi:hypothetical protein
MFVFSAMVFTFHGLFWVIGIRWIDMAHNLRRNLLRCSVG